MIDLNKVVNNNRKKTDLKDTKIMKTTETTTTTTETATATPTSAILKTNIINELLELSEDFTFDFLIELDYIDLCSIKDNFKAIQTSSKKAAKRGKSNIGKELIQYFLTKEVQTMSKKDVTDFLLSKSVDKYFNNAEHVTNSMQLSTCILLNKITPLKESDTNNTAQSKLLKQCDTNINKYVTGVLKENLLSDETSDYFLVYGETLKQFELYHKVDEQHDYLAAKQILDNRKAKLKAERDSE